MEISKEIQKAKLKYYHVMLEKSFNRFEEIVEVLKEEYKTAKDNQDQLKFLKKQIKLYSFVLVLLEELFFVDCIRSSSVFKDATKAAGLKINLSIDNYLKKIFKPSTKYELESIIHYKSDWMIMIEDIIAHRNLNPHEYIIDIKRLIKDKPENQQDYLLKKQLRQSLAPKLYENTDLESDIMEVLNIEPLKQLVK
jgi:hypothetical protein